MPLIRFVPPCVAAKKGAQGDARDEAGWSDLLVAFGALPIGLARATDSGCVLTRPLLRRLLVMPTQLHFTIDAFSLQLLLERAEGLIDIVVTDDDLHIDLTLGCVERPRGRRYR